MSESILKIISDGLIVYFTEKLKEDLPSDTDSRAVFVSSGLKTFDPSKKNRYVLVQPGDTETLSWRHSSAWRKNAPIDVPGYEIGGGAYYWRRMSIEVGAYFVKQKWDADRAWEAAAEFIERVEYFLAHSGVDNAAKIVGQTSQFGEVVLGLWLTDTKITPGGGENNYLWRARIRFDILTGRDL